MNRIDQLFTHKKKDILSIYFTAGYPTLNSTEEIILELEKAGADLIEIGIPFSDPLADGPVIQQSSSKAIANGMHLALLLEQLEKIRRKTTLPIVLMGYLNPIYQYGVEKLLIECKRIGIDGLIIPDLPLEIYEEVYAPYFRQNEVKNIFLVSPLTAIERIHQMDEHKQGFIYFVSAAATTGKKLPEPSESNAYFEQIRDLPLQNAKLIGFGIHHHLSFKNACSYANGAIIGSAFIEALNSPLPLPQVIRTFVQSIRSAPKPSLTLKNIS